MKTPRVSILLATYNRANFLDRAVESVLAQRFADWELIVIDDGEDEATLETLIAWQKRDGRIRYFRIARTGRISIVSNFGFRRSKGKYVAIIDDDDKWALPEKLDKQVTFLDEHPDYVACGGGIIVVDEYGKELFRVFKPVEDQSIRKKALTANPMANSTTLFRKDTAEECGLYDEALAQFADWDFFLKMGLRGKLYNFREYFTFYTMWEKGASFRYQRENAHSARRIVHRYKGKYPGFMRAVVVVYLYFLYAYLPRFVRKFTNPLLSQLKKLLFSR